MVWKFKIKEDDRIVYKGIAQNFEDFEKPFIDLKLKFGGKKKNG